MLSEKKNGSWRDVGNRYDIFFDTIACDIDISPSTYLGDALKVIISSDYDQSQKNYTIILMQHLPIK